MIENTYQFSDTQFGSYYRNCDGQPPYDSATQYTVRGGARLLLKDLSKALHSKHMHCECVFLDDVNESKLDFGFKHTNQHYSSGGKCV